MILTNKKIFAVIGAALAIHLFLLTVLKFTAWPEMTLWPYLITKGWLPYRDIAIAHTPLMLIDLGIFYKIFGTGIWQLKIFTWIIIFSLDVLVYWIAKRLWNKKVAIVAMLSFIVSMLIYDGNGLWFDLYMGVFALVSFYFVRRRNYFWTGIFWALAFISKQTAVWFLIPIGFEIVKETKWKSGFASKVQRSMHFLSGSLLILFILVILLLLFGLLPSFYEWAIRFGIFILPKAQGQIQLPDLKNLIVSLFPFSIFIPLFFNQKSKFLNLFLWSFAGALGAYPRFEYFHFQPALPYLAMAVALVFATLKNDKLVKYFTYVFLFGCTYLFVTFYMRNYKEGVRFYEKDVQEVVMYVKSNTSPGERIFVLNWWDNIYAFSDRLPAVDPWVPQLSWYMETPGLQEKMVMDLQKNKPKMIVLNQYSDFGLSAYKPQTLYNYVLANYQLKEKVDGLNILVPKE